MGANPRTVLKSFARLEEQRKEDRRLDYQLKVALKVAAALGLRCSAIMEEAARLRDERPELFIEAIKDGQIGFPAYLFVACGYSVKFDHLARGAGKAEVFKDFMRVGSRSGLPAAGLIFPLIGLGDWIIHNLRVKPESGKVRLVVPSGLEHLSDVHITSLEQYFKEATR